MLRKKSKQKSGEKFESYLYGVFIGIIFVMLFNLAYFKLNYKIPDTISSFSIEDSRHSGPNTLSIPILMYHYVEVVQDPGDTIRKSLSILPWTFEEQMKTLKENGFTFLTPKDLNSILQAKKKLPQKPIIVSFDDGYRDFYTDVFPILKKHKVKAVQYVISGVIDQPNYLTTQQLEEIAASNLIEVGCHTRYHPALATTSADQALEEISGCQKDLLSKFGIKAVSFAYPYGSYDPFLFPIIKTSGFTNAVTTEAGTNISYSNIYNIPRLRAGSRVGTDLTSYLESSVLAEKTPAPFIKNANAYDSSR